MVRNTFRHVSGPMASMPRKLILAYIFDWVIIVVFAAAGGLLSLVKPHHRNFSLVNLDISQPYVPEQITTWMLGVIAFLVPAIIIALVTLVFVPGSHIRRTLDRSQVLRLKLWELEKGLAGLCLSVAVAFFVTQGMKNLFGKPRPNLLARCLPDVARLAEHVVGAAWGQDVSPRWALVDWRVCTQPDAALLHDGFRSFPSGHSSWSWSGLLYLTLFFCSKFAIAVPHLPLIPAPRPPPPAAAAASSSSRTSYHHRHHPPPPASSSSDHELLPLHGGARAPRGSSEETKRPDPATITDDAGPLALRDAAAAPPNYLLIPALTPVAVAVYVCSTRYAEFYHFGFDIISGSLIGIATAYLSFRWYHLPLARGQGWAWGARSAGRAFMIGVGEGGYVDGRGGGWGRGGEAKEIGGGGGRGGGDVEAGRV